MQYFFSSFQDVVKEASLKENFELQVIAIKEQQLASLYKCPHQNNQQFEIACNLIDQLTCHFRFQKMYRFLIELIEKLTTKIEIIQSSNGMINIIKPHLGNQLASLEYAATKINNFPSLISLKDKIFSYFQSTFLTPPFEINPYLLNLFNNQLVRDYYLTQFHQTYQIQLLNYGHSYTPKHQSLSFLLQDDEIQTQPSQTATYSQYSYQQTPQNTYNYQKPQQNITDPQYQQQPSQPNLYVQQQQQQPQFPYSNQNLQFNSQSTYSNVPQPQIQGYYNYQYSIYQYTTTPQPQILGYHNTQTQNYNNQSTTYGQNLNPQSSKQGQPDYMPFPQTNYVPQPQINYMPFPQTNYVPQPQTNYVHQSQTDSMPQPQIQPQPQSQPQPQPLTPGYRSSTQSPYQNLIDQFPPIQGHYNLQNNNENKVEQQYQQPQAYQNQMTETYHTQHLNNEPKFQQFEQTNNYNTDQNNQYYYPQNQQQQQVPNSQNNQYENYENKLIISQIPQSVTQVPEQYQGNNQINVNLNNQNTQQQLNQENPNSTNQMQDIRQAKSIYTPQITDNTRINTQQQQALLPPPPPPPPPPHQVQAPQDYQYQNRIKIQNSVSYQGSLDDQKSQQNNLQQQNDNSLLEALFQNQSLSKFSLIDSKGQPQLDKTIQYKRDRDMKGFKNHDEHALFILKCCLDGKYSQNKIDRTEEVKKLVGL